MGLSANAPNYADAEQSCVHKPTKPLCAAQNEARSAAPERHHLLWKICAVEEVIRVWGIDSRAGVVGDAIFALGWLVLASFGVVAGSYLPLEAVGRRWGQMPAVGGFRPPMG